MAIVGRVEGIWRYPVKSMGGESLDRATLGRLGVPGDRGWAVRDERSGEFRGAKKFPVLMQCEARYRGEPADDAIPAVEMGLPGGDKTASDADDVNERLSALVGAPVSLWAREPAENREHYRRRERRSREETREILGLEPSEPFPDFSIYPDTLLAELAEFTSPLGTYFDAYPIHLLTTSWLETLREKRPGSRFEAPRFRPNLVIDETTPGLVELEWCGKTLRIGGTVLRCEAPTVRCSMTVQQTGPLPKDAKVLRTIVAETAQQVGIYATVAQAGPVRVGDAVELV